MKKLLMLLVLGSASMIIADDYNPYSGFQQYRCENGSCQMNQGQNRSWNQGNQGFNQDDQRMQNRNQYYSQDERNQGGFRQNDRNGNNQDQRMQGGMNSMNSSNQDQRMQGGMNSYGQNQRMQSGMNAMNSSNQDQRPYGYNRQDDRNAMYSQDQNNQGRWNQNDRNDEDSRDQGMNNDRNDTNSNRDNDRNSNKNAMYSQDRTNSNAMSKTGSDQDLQNKVRDSLNSGWFSKGYQDVTFDVNNGIVTLRGFVASIDDKNKVEDNVKKLDGVRSVNNQITISKNSTSPSSKSSAYSEDQLRANEKKFPQDVAGSDQDRQLNARIRDKISNGWFTTGYETVALRTNNGLVIISGTVDSNDDAQSITDKLKDIDGVRSVNNQLNVKTR